MGQQIFHFIPWNRLLSALLHDRRGILARQSEKVAVSRIPLRNTEFIYMKSEYTFPLRSVTEQILGLFPCWATTVRLQMTAFESSCFKAATLTRTIQPSCSTSKIWSRASLDASIPFAIQLLGASSKLQSCLYFSILLFSKLIYVKKWLTFLWSSFLRKPTTCCWWYLSSIHV